MPHLQIKTLALALALAVTLPATLPAAEKLQPRQSPTPTPTPAPKPTPAPTGSVTLANTTTIKAVDTPESPQKEVNTGKILWAPAGKVNATPLLMPAEVILILKEENVGEILKKFPLSGDAYIITDNPEIKKRLEQAR